LDKKTEQVVRGIYDEIKKTQSDMDWSWVKHEAESLMAGNSPCGTVGVIVQEQLKKVGMIKA
jgi:hypothetical protein